MTNILEKRDEIINNISSYIKNNDVRCATTFFKKEYFTSIDFEREEQLTNGIIYVFPKMKENSTPDDIAEAMMNRFLKENKDLGFKPEQLISQEERFHKDLLIEAVNAYSLNKDILEIKKRNRFDITNFIHIFDRSGDTRDFEQNGKLLEKAFTSVLLGSVDFYNKVNIPNMYAVAEKMGTSEGRQIMKKELGEESQMLISSILPKLKDSSLKNKNKLP